MTDSPKQEYLSQILQMNPLEQPAEILNRRKQFLQPQSEFHQFDTMNSSYEERRTQALEQITTLRKHFWSFKTSVIEQRLNAIDIADFPELTFAIGRLRKIAALRESFTRLQHRCEGHETFYAQFCTLVISSPAEAERLRSTSVARPQGAVFDLELVRPEDERKLARIVQQEFPELHALEKDWLNQLAATSKKSNAIALMVKTLYTLITLAAGISVLLILYLCL
ncbi:hypothetical protein [Gimesia algae]|uniref:Uncharacterized protein n=1 Tax=Gimesia algae TaxID=2527971 RepID=A0A517V620_9PLAN|nr:hypothetical protein [Gimesia algae]QDT88445.1 hypothetical protein Pan161_00610 [Gimesia algae]